MFVAWAVHPWVIIVSVCVHVCVLELDSNKIHLIGSCEEVVANGELVRVLCPQRFSAGFGRKWLSIKFSYMVNAIYGFSQHFM